MSDFDLMTVRQMIDSAFGEVNSSCPVNFTMLGSVLFILARRMQLLKRHFKVQVSLALSKKKVPKPSFKLTEIKIHAKKPKKKERGRSTKVYSILADDLLSVDKVPTGKNKRSARKRQSSLHRSYVGKRLGDGSSSGMSSDDEFSPRKPTAHRRPIKKYTSERRATRQSERHKDDDNYNNDISPGARRNTTKHGKYGNYSDEISPAERSKSGKYTDDMSSAERRKFGKYTDDMSPAERRKFGKYADDMSPAERRKFGKYADDMSPAQQRKFGKYADDMSPAQQRKFGKYADDMSPAERRKFGKYADEISPTERRKAGQYADEMSPTERRKFGKYADDMSPAERRKFGKYADEISPTKRRKARKYSDEMSEPGRRKSENYSDDMSPDERKKYSGRMPSTGRRTGRKYSDQKSATGKSGSGKYFSPSDELSSESAIRGRSRSDKHGAQRGKADDELYSQKDISSRSKETRGYERNIRSHDARQGNDDDDTEEQYEKIYVVTRTPSGREIREPAVLHPVVTQEQFDDLLARAVALKKNLGITNKPTQWDDLRNTNLITNPKAALNMSVRLDSAETRLRNMLDVLEQIAHHVPGLHVQEYLNEKSLHETRRGPVTLSETRGNNRDEHFQPLETELDYDILDVSEPSKPKNKVTHGQFNDESKRMRDGILKTTRQAMEDAGLNNRLSISATDIIVQHLYNRFKDIIKLDSAIEEFGNKVVAIDEHLTFEMTNIQDSLMQAQLELETALEKMNDTLLAPKEDAAAVAQITVEFNEYIKDLDRTEVIQIDLKGDLGVYSQSLKILEERIKTLRADKCTRDEMFEALDDKLTLKDINGMLTEDQFGAVNAEMKETLQHLYLAMFAKECDWQRIIGDVKEKFYECAEPNQILTLNESIRKEFTTMDKDVNDLLEILGPLKKSPTDKKIEHDDNCLCCGAPAETKRNKLSVKLWQQMMSRDAVKSVKLTPEEISELCVPGQPIPHPLELDSFVCAHDCGDIVKTTDVFDMYIKELKSSNTSNSMTTTSKKNTAEDHGTLQ